MLRLAAKALISRRAFLNEINEKEMNRLLSDIEESLLKGDMNLEAAQGFISQLREKVEGEGRVGVKNLESHLLSTMHKEMTKMLGGDKNKLSRGTKRILFFGLNGAGKTSLVAKMANYLQKNTTQSVCVTTLDFKKPGAHEHLKLLCKGPQIPFVEPVSINNSFSVEKTINSCLKHKSLVKLFDTAGTIGEIGKLSEIQRQIKPDETLFVLDAMAGQEIIQLIRKLLKELSITGIVVTKTDSDAPMGAALSINYLLNIPIKFISSGEKLRDFSEFESKKITKKIFGEEDVFELAEKINTETNINSQNIFAKIINGHFDLDDLMTQFSELKKVGSLKKMSRFLPNPVDEGTLENAERQLRIWKFLVNAMTPEERKKPKLFKKEPERRARVLKESGRTPDELNKLLKRWEEGSKKIQELSKRFKKDKNILSMFKDL